MQRRILVIRGGALGDFILTLPVLAALRRHFPDHGLEVLGHPRFASLAAAAGLAENVQDLDSPRLAGLFAPNGAWEADISDYFARFDWVISYLYDPGQVFQTNVARCSRARFIAGPHRPDEAAGLHATEALLGPLQLLGISNAEAMPVLQLPGTAPWLAPAKWLAAHPGSDSRRKNWPQPKWMGLLPSPGGTDDMEFIPHWRRGGRGQGAEPGRRPAARPGARRSRLAAGAIGHGCRECAAFLGHDSGIAHLAAALGLPGAVLWGDTAPAVCVLRAKK